MSAAGPMTIDMTPTWEESAQMFIVLLESGTFEGKAFARAEIKRMGRILDDQVKISRDKKGGAL